MCARWIGSSLLACGAVASVGAAQSPKYVFEALASSSDVRVGFASARIDDDGRVAFNLSNSSTGQEDLVRVEVDGSFTLLANTSGPIASFNGSTFNWTYSEMNNSGVVAFIALMDTGEQAVLIADGYVLTQVASNLQLPPPMLATQPGCNAYPFPPMCPLVPQADVPSFFGVSINDFGHVAFLCRRGCRGKNAILLWSQGSLSVAVDDAIDPCPFSPCAAGALIDLGDLPRINNSGEIALHGRLCGSAPPGGCSPSSPLRTFVGKATAGGPLTVVAFDDGLPANFTGGGYPTLNDAGEVAFDGGCAFQTVVESSASGLSVIASTQFPSPWVTLTSCAINDQGVVLIRAWDGGGPVVTAGQHPVNDRILGGKSSGGDPLFGSRVQSIEVSHDALNNAGEVALAVSLVDGRRTIVRASPVGAPLGTSYCEGSAGCPCNNNSASGSGRGCANTNGIGARLVAHGSTSVGANDLWFSADFLTGSTALLFLGTSVVNTPLGDGLKCAGGAITRLGVRAPDAELQSSWSHALASIGGWNAGDTRRFQVWYRSGSTSPCPMPKDINFSNAVEITFTP